MKSALFKNYFFLSIYQAVNFAVPLIIVPIIIARVGVENFGLIAFSYAFANYFNVIVDYGFNLSATKKISLHRSSKEVINSTFTTVYISKFIFLLLSFLLYSVLVYYISFLHQYWMLHLCSFTIVIGQALIPVWLFQGLEDMKYLAVCNLLSKLGYFVLVLFFIKIPSDFFSVNLFQGLSGIGAGLLSLFLSFKKFKASFIPVTRKNILLEIKEGRLLFFSSLAINIYINTNAFILGIFATPAEVGIYSIAEKVYFALKQLDNVFSQVIFPQICILAQKSAIALQAFLKKIFIPFSFLVSIVCIAVFFTAPYISAYFLKGVSDSHLIYLIRIFCFTVFINAFNTPTFQTLLAYNEKGKLGIVLFTGCVINIIANLVLANLFQSTGSSLSVLITETSITAGLGYYYLQVLKQQKQNEITHTI